MQDYRGHRFRKLSLLEATNQTATESNHAKSEMFGSFNTIAEETPDRIIIRWPYFFATFKDILSDGKSLWMINSIDIYV